MGAYLSTTSLSLLMPGYFKGNTTGSDTTGVNIAQHHIDRAESRVNAALALRYSVPFSTTGVPPVVRTIVEDMTVYNLLMSTGFRQGQMNEYVEQNYKDSVDTLKKLADGELPLTMTDGSYVSVDSSRYKSSHEDYEMVFNVDDADNWDPTDTETDDVADTRD